MNPNDLGELQIGSTVAENIPSVNINDYVRRAKNGLKKTLMLSEMDVTGVKVELVVSKTGFGGERLWFKCPRCGGRVGVLYKTESVLGCRKCLHLMYRKQRYGKMEELRYNSG